jgi:hypothetical protein
MNQDEARQLKALLQRELVGAQQAIAIQEPPLSIEMGVRSIDMTTASLQQFAYVANIPRHESFQTDLVLATPALGIARRDKEFLLAVRVQTEGEAANPFIDLLTDRSDGQLDVRSAVGARAHSGGAGNRHRPVIPGVSIGRINGVTGTLGCFITRQGGVVEGLASNHVLADANRGATGDDVLQPGIHDGGTTPNDRVGELSYFHPLVSPPQANAIDAALCKFDDAIAAVPPSPPLTAFDVDPGEGVRKQGRTTGQTQGEVSAIEIDGLVLDVPGIGPAIFDGVFEVESGDGSAFSDLGDSGALVTDLAGARGAGILLGGLGPVSWVIPLSTTLQVLKAALVT